MERVLKIVHVIHDSEEDRVRAKAILQRDPDQVTAEDWSFFLPDYLSTDAPKQVHLTLVHAFCAYITTTDHDHRGLVKRLFHLIKTCPAHETDVDYQASLGKLHTMMGQLVKASKRYVIALHLSKDQPDMTVIQRNLTQVLFFLYGELGDHEAIRALLSDMYSTTLFPHLVPYITCWTFILAVKEGKVDQERSMEKEIVLIFTTYKDLRDEPLHIYGIYTMGHVVLRWIAQGRMTRDQVQVYDEVIQHLAAWVEVDVDHEEVALTCTSHLRPLMLRLLLASGELMKATYLEENDTSTGFDTVASDGKVELLLHKINPLCGSAPVTPLRMMELCRERISCVYSMDRWAITTLDLLGTFRHLSLRHSRRDLLPEIQSMIRTVCTRSRGLERTAAYELATCPEYMIETLYHHLYWTPAERIVGEFLYGTNDDAFVRITSVEARKHLGILNYYKAKKKFTCNLAQIEVVGETNVDRDTYPELALNAFRILVVKILDEHDKAASAWKDLQLLDDQMILSHPYHRVMHRYLTARARGHAPGLASCKVEVEAALLDITERKTRTVDKNWPDLCFFLLSLALTRDRLLLRGNVLNLAVGILKDQLRTLSAVVSPLSPAKYDMQTIVCHYLEFMLDNKRKVEATSLAEAFLLYVSFLQTLTGKTHPIPDTMRPALEGAITTVTMDKEVILALDFGGMFCADAWKRKDPQLQTPTARRNQKRREKQQQRKQRHTTTPTATTTPAPAPTPTPTPPPPSPTNTATQDMETIIDLSEHVAQQETIIDPSTTIEDQSEDDMENQFEDAVQETIIDPSSTIEDAVQEDTTETQFEDAMENQFEDTTRDEDYDRLMCPISFVLMDRAVVASDGHTYQESSLKQHIDYATTHHRPLLSPMTNLPFDGLYFPNYLVRALVQELDV